MNNINALRKQKSKIEADLTTAWNQVKTLEAKHDRVSAQIHDLRVERGDFDPPAATTEEKIYPEPVKYMLMDGRAVLDVSDRATVIECAESDEEAAQWPKKYEGYDYVCIAADGETLVSKYSPNTDVREAWERLTNEEYMMRGALGSGKTNLFHERFKLDLPLVTGKYLTQMGKSEPPTLQDDSESPDPSPDQ